MASDDVLTDRSASKPRVRRSLRVVLLITVLAALVALALSLPPLPSSKPQRVLPTAEPKNPDIVLGEDLLQACMALRTRRGNQATLAAYHDCKDSARTADATRQQRCLVVLTDAGAGIFSAAAWCKEHNR